MIYPQGVPDTHPPAHTHTHTHTPKEHPLFHTGTCPSKYK